MIGSPASAGSIRALTYVRPLQSLADSISQALIEGVKGFDLDSRISAACRGSNDGRVNNHCKNQMLITHQYQQPSVSLWL